MTTPAPAEPFDARPLVEPVDLAAIAAHRHHLAATGRTPGSRNVQAIIALVVIAVFGLGAFAPVGFLFIGLSSSDGFGALALVGLLPLLFVAAVVAFIIFYLVRNARRGRERAYRLDRFAGANGLTWYPEATDPPLPGMIFHQGRARVASDLLRGTQPRFVEFANYRYTTGSGKNSTTHHWGYIAVKLSAPLPHIVLDAVGNNGLLGSNLPASFDKEQLLSLEGDFDRYFRLYCPAGYERDALYLFTPDIMARLIDNAAELDVEIVDDWLFLYARRDFSTLDPRMWAWLFSVVGALLGKIAQWERWRDERLVFPEQHGQRLAHPQPMTAHPGQAGTPAPGATSPGAAAMGAAAMGAQSLPFTPPTAQLRPPVGVARQGQRLRRRIPRGTIVLIGLFAVLWVGMQTGMFGLFSLLSR
ncbi:hypothetical protein H9651_12660 [Microbacterium sp. Sa4CUA7]|uniref:DUF3137 domain-containing protein n=1 Tax=Microbacterium pullorum TaxID=2762236 RepID=A0ABR8S4U1_9MICO|nr:hypothetical protein [Microbacterium pullorum]MBD7958493.1 hypothetical protein [Microbacterium pullorum]